MTGLNANVFYELGLTHAINKKVVIITQDMGKLLFDIKSYRVNEYSLQFNKLPELIIKLRTLLCGAMDNSVKYDNPVFDYSSNFYEVKNIIEKVDNAKAIVRDECGIADINENVEKMTDELVSMSNEMNTSITATTNEIDYIKSTNGNVDVLFIRIICRKLSKPVEVFAEKLNVYISEIAIY